MLTYVNGYCEICDIAYFDSMELKAGEYQTAGQLLSAVLRERGWTKRVLAAVVGLDQTTVGRILNDKKPLDAATAIVFSEVFGIPAERLLTVQQEYELAKARLTAQPDPSREHRARLLSELPIAEMVSRGWIPPVDVRDVASVEAALNAFFGRDVSFPHAAKKTNAEDEPTWLQMAWLTVAEKIARTMDAPRYSPTAVRDAIEKLKPLRASVEGIGRVGAMLAEAGVRYVVVQSPEGAKIDGACFWLNDMSPVIAMSLRHDRLDNFWFVLRHECEHVLRGHGRRRPMIDVDIEAERAMVREEERLADEAAQDFCVPSEQMDTFMAKKAPYFIERDIVGFAGMLKLHPALVVGQIQHRTRRYDRFRKFLPKVREFVVGNVVADGWGNTVLANLNQARV
jgi:HTH-type transcriptional regulator/antitoxin HigA